MPYAIMLVIGAAIALVLSGSLDRAMDAVANGDVSAAFGYLVADLGKFITDSDMDAANRGPR